MPAPKRERYEMPDYIRAALMSRNVMEAYLARPPYQQNDYIGWITRAVRGSTRVKRLNQMLDELEHGGVYMRMKWRPGDLLEKRAHEVVFVGSFIVLLFCAVGPH
jgi:hypothetical protein